MAIYHLSVKTVSRSAGRSATAAAAYRAGVSITDGRTGEIHDYTRKGGVQSATLIVPAEAAAWANDREVIWNAAEQAEKRKNSTVAREFEIALPSELSPAERQRLAVDFAHELVARHGCAADVAIHAPGKEGDNRNDHAHILLTTRRLTPEGMGEKTRELDDQKTGKELVTQWRERFATLQNERLREAGHAVQVDHRSHAERGLQAMPTWHLGPAATAIERRTGQRSRIGQDFDQAAAERLRKAQEAGQLERQAQAVDRSIIDLTGDLQAALRERDKAQEAQRLAEWEAQTTANAAAFKAERAAATGIDPRSRYHPDNIAAREAAERAAEQDAQAEQAQKLALRTQRMEVEKAAIEAKRVAQVPAPTPAPVRPPAARLDPAEAEKQRLSRMSSTELAEEIRRRQLPSVDSEVERDRAVMASTAKRRELHKQEETGKAFVLKAEQAIDAWREQHPLKAKMHDSGVFRSAELAQRVQKAEEGQQALQAVQMQARSVAAKDAELRKAVRSQVVASQAEGRADLVQLEKLHQVKTTQERAAATARRELEAVPKEFRAMAASREAKAFGWSDKGSKWQAAPEQLQKLIDGYNAAPREVRASMLDRITSDRGSKQLRELLDAQQANYRQNDRGMSR